jgi:tetratricopeptide (TPR) repeat protein
MTVLPLVLLLTSAVLQDPVLARADSLLLEAHRPAEALAVYQDVLNGNPGDFEALWRASRACLILGILEDEWETRKEWHRRGEEFALRAEALRPEDLVALYWRAANLGRWAQEEPGPREILRLARAVRRAADRVLRADPDHAGAHNVLGMFYFEILDLSGLERGIARLLAPSVVGRVRWRDAANHLRRAVALDPYNVLYLKDYGRALLWHGDVEEARIHLERALDLPVVLPTDPVFLREARILRDRAEG